MRAQSVPAAPGDGRAPHPTRATEELRSTLPSTIDAPDAVRRVGCEPETRLTVPMRGWMAKGGMALYGALAVVQVVAILVGASTLRTWSQFFLMPALMIVAQAPILSDLRTAILYPLRDRVGIGLALLLACAGDVIPRIFPASELEVLVGCFFLSQLVWLWVLGQWYQRSILVRQPTLIIPYVAVAAIVLSACLPGGRAHLGYLPLVGLCVAGLAVLATGTNRLGTISGLGILVTDAALALCSFVLAFDPGDPVRGLVIMPFYILSQLGIVIAVRNRLLADALQRPGVSVETDARMTDDERATLSQLTAASPGGVSGVLGLSTEPHHWGPDPLPGPEAAHIINTRRRPAGPALALSGADADSDGVSG